MALYLLFYIYLLWNDEKNEINCNSGSETTDSISSASNKKN